MFAYWVSQISFDSISILHPSRIKRVKYHSNSVWPSLMDWTPNYLSKSEFPIQANLDFPLPDFQQALSF